MSRNEASGRSWHFACHSRLSYPGRKVKEKFLFCQKNSAQRAFPEGKGPLRGYHSPESLPLGEGGGVSRRMRGDLKCGLRLRQGAHCRGARLPRRAHGTTPQECVQGRPLAAHKTRSRADVGANGIRPVCPGPYPSRPRKAASAPAVRATMAALAHRSSTTAARRSRRCRRAERRRGVMGAGLGSR